MPHRFGPDRSCWARPWRSPRSAMAIVMAAGLGGVIAILIQGRVPLEFRPFLLLWGLLLVPTFLVWTCFVIAVHTLTRNRYTTYAIGLGVIGFTAYRLLANEINWVGNWPLWSAVRWSDISVLEIDRKALVLSRLLAVGAAVFFLALTVRTASRRESDPVRVMHRLRPQAVRGTVFRLLPWALLPFVAGTWLALEIGWGHEGSSRSKTGQGLLAQEPGHLSRRGFARSHTRQSRPRALS